MSPSSKMKKDTKQDPLTKETIMLKNESRAYKRAIEKAQVEELRARTEEHMRKNDEINDGIDKASADLLKAIAGVQMDMADMRAQMKKEQELREFCDLQILNAFNASTKSQISITTSQQSINTRLITKVAALTEKMEQLSVKRPVSDIMSQLFGFSPAPDDDCEEEDYEDEEDDDTEKYPFVAFQNALNSLEREADSLGESACNMMEEIHDAPLEINVDGMVAYLRTAVEDIEALVSKLEKLAPEVN